MLPSRLDQTLNPGSRLRASAKPNYQVHFTTAPSAPRRLQRITRPAMADDQNHVGDDIKEPLLPQAEQGQDAAAAEDAAAQDPSSTTVSSNPGAAKWCLMGSYSLGAWAWRSWEFAVALLLITLYPDSLLMVSVYGLVDNGVRVLFGPSVGSFISNHNLLPGATAAYLWQNTCIGISAACALALLLLQQQASVSGQVFWPLMGVMVALGALSSVGSSGVRIAVEVEAVTALAAGNSGMLSELNAGFRAIDLSALLLAPLLVGAVMTWLGPPAATLLLAGYTLLAWIPETVLLQRALHLAPYLSEFKAKRQAERQQHTQASGAKPGRLHSLGMYLQQPTLLPNLALACLYCTVLSLGFLMTGYLQWTGLSSAEVSVYRGVGALTGLAATMIFPPVAKRLGLVTTGLLGIGYQLASLCAGVLPVAFTALGQPGGPGALQPTQDLVRILVAGVVASRTGLWMFDLAVTQLVQERVPHTQLGVVCGVQSSLQACCETLSFLAGIFLADPTLFYWLMIASLCVVGLAALTYTLFAIKQGCFGPRHMHAAPADGDV